MVRGRNNISRPWNLALLAGNFGRVEQTEKQALGGQNLLQRMHNKILRQRIRSPVPPPFPPPPWPPLNRLATSHGDRHHCCPPPPGNCEVPLPQANIRPRFSPSTPGPQGPASCSGVSWTAGQAPLPTYNTPQHCRRFSLKSAEDDYF